MLTKSKLSKVILAGVFTVAAAFAAAQGYVPHRVLLKFANGISNSHAQAVLASVGARIDRELPRIGVEVLQLPASANEEAVAAALSHRPDVEFAELDEIRAPAQVTPNDPRFVYGWHLTKIGAPTAWNTTTGSSSVVIAILDSGCDATHEDLTGKYVPGWNVYNNNSDTSDVFGHGTPVAGVAAASSNNGLGVASIAWGCKLMPIRITDTTGYATFSAMASGVTWASDHGARVANLSFIASDSAAVRSAAQYMMGRGGVVTISAGNNAAFSSTADNLYVLTVSATDESDALATFSNTGNNVDLAAPGMYVYTTNRGGGYGAPNGTSFSAPIVAGVAALVMSANPSLTGAQVQQILKDSAYDLGAAGWDPSFGWGRVDAARAVALAVGTAGGGAGGPGDTIPPTAAFLQPTAGLTLQGPFTVSAQATDNVGVTSMTISLDGVLVASSNTASCSYSWNTLNSANGDHQLTVVAKDAANNTGSQTITVGVLNTVDTTPPSITITSPTGGSVGNSVSVRNNATDNVAVTKVEMYLDGKLVGTSTSAPFSFSLNSRKWSRGSHSLQARAYDAAANWATSQVVTLTK